MRVWTRNHGIHFLCSVYSLSFSELCAHITHLCVCIYIYFYMHNRFKGRTQNLRKDKGIQISARPFVCLSVCLFPSVDKILSPHVVRNSILTLSYSITRNISQNNYEDFWFKYWRCVVPELKHCMSHFGLRYLKIKAYFHSVNWPAGGQIHYAGLTKYNGTIHMFVFFFIKLQLKLCIYLFIFLLTIFENLKIVKKCANFHLVNWEGFVKTI